MGNADLSKCCGARGNDSDIDDNEVRNRDVVGKPGDRRRISRRTFLLENEERRSSVSPEEREDKSRVGKCLFKDALAEKGDVAENEEEEKGGKDKENVVSVYPRVAENESERGSNEEDDRRRGKTFGQKTNEPWKYDAGYRAPDNGKPLSIPWYNESEGNRMIRNGDL